MASVALRQFDPALRIVRTGFPRPSKLLPRQTPPPGGSGARRNNPRGCIVNYNDIFARAIDRLHEEGRYRVFIDILRNKGSYPNERCFAGPNGPKPITVRCSNDYLSMGQHPDRTSVGWERGGKDG